MKRKLIYFASFLVILAGIMIPVIYANKISGQKQAPENFAINEKLNPGTGEQSSSLKSENLNEGNKAILDTSGQSDVKDDLSTRNTTVQESYPSKAAGREQVVPAVKKPSGSPPEAVKENGCAAFIAVVGVNGELFYGPASITVTKKDVKDVTALDALEATGLPYSLSTRWPGFIEEIAGQRNKGQSGWMYLVNGEVPLVAAGQKQIKGGDKVIWWYSKSMNNPLPNWDGLVKRD